MFEFFGCFLCLKTRRFEISDIKQKQKIRGLYRIDSTCPRRNDSWLFETKRLVKDLTVHKHKQFVWSLKYEDKLYEFSPNVCFYYKVSFCVSIPRLQQQNTEETNRENIPVWLDETLFEAVMWRGPPHIQQVVASLFVTQLLVLSPPLGVLAWSRLKVKAQSSQTSAGFCRSSSQPTERLRRRTWTLMP